MHDHEEKSWSSRGLKQNIHSQPNVGTWRCSCSKGRDKATTDERAKIADIEMRQIIFIQSINQRILTSV